MKTTIINEVLSRELISEIKQYPSHVNAVQTNLTAWPGRLVQLSGPIILYTLPDDICSKLRTEINLKTPIPAEWEMIATYTLGSRFSYVPWHDDANHLRSLTIYLNEEWDRDWGGMFVYEDEDQLSAVLPSFNRALMFTPPLWHSVSPVTLSAPIRHSIQIFWNEAGKFKSAY